MSQMTPREIVQELDKHIVGQTDAKRAVAIALRNRWRRAQIEDPMRGEITPKNILMIGPTGVDAGDRRVALAEGASQSYDRLLIATGSHTTRPPIPGIVTALHTECSLEGDFYSDRSPGNPPIFSWGQKWRSGQATRANF